MCGRGLLRDDDLPGLYSRARRRVSGISARCPLRAYALFIIVGIVVALVHRRPALGGPRRRTRRHLRHRVVGRAVRPDRRPALPRHHRLADVLRRRRRGTRRRRCGSGTAAWASGARWRSAASARGSAAAGGAFRCRPSATRSRPGIILAQAIGRLGNYFNQELYGRPTTLPWGLEIFERRDAAGSSTRLAERCVDRPVDRGGPSDVSVRIALERPGFRGPDLGRPAIQDRPRPAVRAVCGGLLRRPVLGRADAQRHRHAHRRHPDQLVHVDVRVHRRGGVHHGRAEGPRGSRFPCR